jgi:hypothetical protein
MQGVVILRHADSRVLADEKRFVLPSDKLLGYQHTRCMVEIVRALKFHTCNLGLKWPSIRVALNGIDLHAPTVANIRLSRR